MSFSILFTALLKLGKKQGPNGQSLLLIRFLKGMFHKSNFPDGNTKKKEKENA